MNVQARMAQTLCSGLVRAGVRYAVVSPGSRNTPLIIALDALAHEHRATPDTPRIHILNVLDERAAGFVALGLSKTMGPTLLCCTSGSALGHYLPAVMEAAADALPLVVLSADRPLELQHVGAPQTSIQAYSLHPHVVDELHISSVVSRRAAVSPAVASAPGADVSVSEYLDSVEDKHLRWVARQAERMVAATALQGGPVHINIEFRKPLHSNAPTSISLQPGQEAKAAPLVLSGERQLEGAQIQALRARLDAAERGVLFCGHHAGIQSDTANALARVLGWPLLAEVSSGVRGGVLHVDLLCAQEAFINANTPDVVLHFGRAPTSNGVSALLSASSERIMVDGHGRYLDPSCTATRLVIAHPQRLAEDLLHATSALKSAPQSSGSGWLGHWERAQHIAEKEIALHHPRTDSSTEQPNVHAGRGAATAEEPGTPACYALSEGAITHAFFRNNAHALFIGSSMPIRDANSLGHSYRLVYANRGLNGIDGGLATAAGIAIGLGGEVRALVGDLSFLHDIAGLMAAKTLAHKTSTPPAAWALRIVVVNNGGGRIFEHLPIASAYPKLMEQYFTTPHTHDIGQLCNALNIAHERVEDTHALSEALEHTPKGVSVVQAMVDPNFSKAERQALSQRVALALREDAGFDSAYQA